MARDVSVEFYLQKYGFDLSHEGVTACPRCRRNGRDNSGDNLRMYGLDENGKHKGAFCWSCEFTIKDQAELERLDGEEIEEEDVELMGSPFNEQIFEELKAQSGLDPRGFRGLRQDISQSFGVRYQYDTQTGQVNRQMYPCTEDADNDKKYNLTGFKIRLVPKAFGTPIGETGKDAHMFGQFKHIDKRTRDILIVGGELDQLSATQMLTDYQNAVNAKKGTDYDPCPVVSPTIGESGAHKQVAANYEFFNRFERVLICMDNDKAGREAAEKVAKALPKGKAFIVEMGRKDPNSYIWDEELQKPVDRTQEFLKAFFAPQPYTPSGIVGSGSLMGKMKEAVRVPKIPLPPFMHKVQKMMAGGIPLKRIVNLGSASGTGKSTIVDECVYYWVFNSPHRVGVVSLEDDAAEYGIKVLSRHIGKKINLIEDDNYKAQLLDSPEVEAKAQELFFHEDGSHRWHLLDERDGGIDDLKEKVIQLIVQCDCKVIILDPLQDILDGMSNEEQAVFMKWQKGLTKSHGVTFININHVRKSGQGGKQNSAGADLFEEDFQGSSSIFKSGACNLLFTRNKEAESDILRNITYMKMTKCRWTGNTGPKAGEYYYNNETHTIHDLQAYLDSNPTAKREYELAMELLAQAEG